MVAAAAAAYGRAPAPQLDATPLGAPPVVVGFESNWLVVQPGVLPHWDKVSLEPYAPPKAVQFHVLCPEQHVTAARLFTKDLTAAFSALRLGSHLPARTPAHLHSLDGVIPVPLEPGPLPPSLSALPGAAAGQGPASAVGSPEATEPMGGPGQHPLARRVDRAAIRSAVLGYRSNHAQGAVAGEGGWLAPDEPSYAPRPAAGRAARGGSVECGGGGAAGGQQGTGVAVVGKGGEGLAGHGHAGTAQQPTAAQQQACVPAEPEVAGPGPSASSPWDGGPGGRGPPWGVDDGPLQHYWRNLRHVGRQLQRHLLLQPRELVYLRHASAVSGSAGGAFAPGLPNAGRGGGAEGATGSGAGGRDRPAGQPLMDLGPPALVLYVVPPSERPEDVLRCLMEVCACLAPVTPAARCAPAPPPGVHHPGAWSQQHPHGAGAGGGAVGTGAQSYDGPTRWPGRGGSGAAFDRSSADTGAAHGAPGAAQGPGAGAAGRGGDGACAPGAPGAGTPPEPPAAQEAWVHAEAPELVAKFGGASRSLYRLTPVAAAAAGACAAAADAAAVRASGNQGAAAGAGGQLQLQQLASCEVTVQLLLPTALSEATGAFVRATAAAAYSKLCRRQACYGAAAAAPSEPGAAPDASGPAPFGLRPGGAACAEAAAEVGTTPGADGRSSSGNSALSLNGDSSCAPAAPGAGFAGAGGFGTGGARASAGSAGSAAAWGAFGLCSGRSALHEPLIILAPPPAALDLGEANGDAAAGGMCDAEGDGQLPLQPTLHCCYSWRRLPAARTAGCTTSGAQGPNTGASAQQQRQQHPQAERCSLAMAFVDAQGEVLDSRVLLLSSSPGGTGGAAAGWPMEPGGGQAAAGRCGGVLPGPFGARKPPLLSACSCPAEAASHEQPGASLEAQVCRAVLGHARALQEQLACARAGGGGSSGSASAAAAAAGSSCGHDDGGRAGAAGAAAAGGSTLAVVKLGAPTAAEAAEWAELLDAEGAAQAPLTAASPPGGTGSDSYAAGASGRAGAGGRWALGGESGPDSPPDHDALGAGAGGAHGACAARCRPCLAWLEPHPPVAVAPGCRVPQGGFALRCQAAAPDGAAAAGGGGSGAAGAAGSGLHAPMTLCSFPTQQPGSACSAALEPLARCLRALTVHPWPAPPRHAPQHAPHAQQPAPHAQHPAAAAAADPCVHPFAAAAARGDALQLHHMLPGPPPQPLQRQASEPAPPPHHASVNPSPPLLTPDVSLADDLWGAEGEGGRQTPMGSEVLGPGLAAPGAGALLSDGAPAPHPPADLAAEAAGGELRPQHAQHAQHLPSLIPQHSMQQRHMHLAAKRGYADSPDVALAEPHGEGHGHAGVGGPPPSKRQHLAGDSAHHLAAPGAGPAGGEQRAGAAGAGALAATAAGCSASEAAPLPPCAPPLDAAALCRELYGLCVLRDGLLAVQSGPRGGPAVGAAWGTARAAAAGGAAALLPLHAAVCHQLLHLVEWCDALAGGGGGAR